MSSLQKSLLGPAKTWCRRVNARYPDSGRCARRISQGRPGRNSSGGFLCRRPGPAETAQGRRPELGGIGARATTAVWGSVGERAIEGADPINTGPLPRTNHGGRAHSLSCAAARDAGGRPGRCGQANAVAPPALRTAKPAPAFLRGRHEGGMGVSQDSPDSFSHELSTGTALRCPSCATSA